MLSCWSCGLRFHQKMILRDGTLKGRTAAEGGPFRVYRCPSCHKESRVETIPGGSLFASPLKEISAVEFLFSWTELLTPTDFLRINQWHRQNATRRRHAFEREGDHRYSRGGFRGFLERLFTQRSSQLNDPTGSRPSSPSQGDSAREPRAEEPREQPTESRVVPHPYRILGVPPEASDSEIRRAFRRLARRYHPDKQRSRDPRALEEASRRLNELLRAYESLQE